MKRGALAGAALAALLVASPAVSRAQTSAAPAPPPLNVAVEAVPMFGGPTAIAWGGTRSSFASRTTGRSRCACNVEISAGQYGHERSFQATAPYSAGAGASVHVRVPVRVVLFGEVHVRVFQGGSEARPSPSRR